jgi:hypothetical protein
MPGARGSWDDTVSYKAQSGRLPFAGQCRVVKGLARVKEDHTGGVAATAA